MAEQNSKPTLFDKKMRKLCQALISFDSPEECKRFLLDLCTPKELEALCDRWIVVSLLEKGIPYRDIYKQTGVSTATITRVARALKGSEGGYRTALEHNVRRDADGHKGTIK